MGLQKVEADFESPFNVLKPGQQLDADDKLDCLLSSGHALRCCSLNCIT